MDNKLSPEAIEGLNRMFSKEKKASRTNQSKSYEERKAIATAIFLKHMAKWTLKNCSQ